MRWRVFLFLSVMLYIVCLNAFLLHFRTKQVSSPVLNTSSLLYSRVESVSRHGTSRCTTEPVVVLWVKDENSQLTNAVFTQQLQALVQLRESLRGSTVPTILAVHVDSFTSVHRTWCKNLPTKCTLLVLEDGMQRTLFQRLTQMQTCYSLYVLLQTEARTDSSFTRSLHALPKHEVACLSLQHRCKGFAFSIPFSFLVAHRRNNIDIALTAHNNKQLQVMPLVSEVYKT